MLDVEKFTYVCRREVEEFTLWIRYKYYDLSTPISNNVLLCRAVTHFPLHFTFNVLDIDDFT